MNITTCSHFWNFVNRNQHIRLKHRSFIQWSKRSEQTVARRNVQTRISKTYLLFDSPLPQELLKWRNLNFKKIYQTSVASSTEAVSTTGRTVHKRPDQNFLLLAETGISRYSSCLLGGGEHTQPNMQSRIRIRSQQKVGDKPTENQDRANLYTYIPICMYNEYKWIYVDMNK